MMDEPLISMLVSLSILFVGLLVWMFHERSMRQFHEKQSSFWHREYERVSKELEEIDSKMRGDE